MPLEIVNITTIDQEPEKAQELQGELNAIKEQLTTLEQQKATLIARNAPRSITITTSPRIINH